MASPPQTGPTPAIVTFLFTDIEGSTRRWEADPAAMRAALARHDDVLRTTIEGHGGQVFKHTGDGICATFASPSAAVDAAVAAQRELELPVRMGIATGEAEQRDGDYFGPVLNRAARVMAAGHGRQILFDGATAALAIGVDLMPLGARRLRDIAKPVEIYQVRASGLEAHFPPLRTVDSTPGNLRTLATSFVGREGELDDVAAALSANRLVTLTGVGGVGKTRLAEEVAAHVAGDFPEGVWVIELASIADPAAVPDAVATTLGISQQPGMNLAESVAVTLHGRHRLLVFDNCEHVLDAAADLIDTIFRHSSTAKVLATSREGLRLPDEQLWPVPALDLTSGISSSAATLFTDRAAGVIPGIELNIDDAAAVVEICRRLDGIPLAIELAASRLVSMTVTELRDRLDDRFRLLVGSRRGLERHQTLRHAVQWSFDLLDDREKDLLTRCSVFAGGFDLAGATAVAGPGDELTTLDLLDALVRKSLLVTDRSSRHARFTMLETIRQFAEERLVATGSAQDIRASHARYYATREAPMMTLWDGPGQPEVYRWFGAELANLRTAFRWAADHDSDTDLDNAVAIAIYATALGTHTGQYEPITWVEEIIDRARRTDHRRLAQLFTAAAECSAVGRVDEFHGFAPAAEDAIRSGRYVEVDEVMEISAASGYLAIGEQERCIEWCKRVIERSPGTHMYARTGLSLALTARGLDGDAEVAARDLLMLADRCDNPNLTAYALLGYGYGLRYRDPATAYEILRRALTICHDTGNAQMASPVALVLGQLAIRHGQFLDAVDFLVETIRYRFNSGSLLYQRMPLAVLATLLGRLGEDKAATNHPRIRRAASGKHGLPRDRRDGRSIAGGHGPRCLRHLHPGRRGNEQPGDRGLRLRTRRTRANHTH
ncbi:ATP-binding protein [Mycolicibacterium fortuitum]|uniref:ATP-binding protein n=1 Tax=Mycolicibacterium fortuitum TaxID=1766 RepID=UPI001CE22BD6|nr:adenylate/guanylate cyclase domain-containing protein [Mycolicibacterium fortuitum]